MEGLDIPAIDAESREMLDSPISLDELDIATKQLAPDKCAGPDGFTANFYHKLWPIIKYTLHSVYMKVVEQDEMFRSALEGTVSLMEKRDKNALNITNWQPLTMLNTDYKIYAKIMANKLQLVLPQIIYKDQVGFMKNRTITSNIRDLLNVVEYCAENRLDSIIMAVDYEKAFDMVSWTAMKTIMKAF